MVRNNTGDDKQPDAHRSIPPERVKEQLNWVEKTIREKDAMLIAWLTKKFGDSEAARDIAQDAYLRVWRYAQQHLIDNPQALLFKTAANLSANEFRNRRLKQTQHIVSTTDHLRDQVENLPCDAPSQERISTARREIEISMNAIHRLPEKARRAFIMSRFQDMNYTEIAEQMGVSVSSVEKYIITALHELRSALRDDEQPKGKVIQLQVDQVGKS